MSLLSAFQTPPASPQLRPGSAFSEPNSPPPQESCFCGQIIPYEDDGIYCSRSCAHEATLSSLLKGTVSAGIQSPSPSSIGSSISRPQTPTSQIIQTDVSKVPRAPSRIRTSVKSRSSTYSSAWSNLDESPLISSSLPKFETSIYDYSSEEEDQVKIVRHGLRKQLRASPNAGKLGQALFGDGSSDSGAQSSSRVGLKGIKEAEGEAADEGQVRGMSSSTIASINLSLRLGLEGAHQSHGADGAALKEETNGEEENFKSAFSNSIRNSSASKSTSLPQRTILERHLSSATSSCPTPLVSQLPYRSSIITQGSGSAGTVNQSSPPLQAQPIWSSYSYSPQFSDVSGSSGSTHDSFWDRSGLELMGSPPRKGSVSDRSGSFSSSAARSRATTVSSQDDTTRVPSDCAEETSQVKSGVSRSSLYDLNQMIQRTFDSFDAFEYDAIDNDGLDSQYSTPLGFEEMKLHPVEDTSPGTSPASPIFDFRTHGSPPLTSSNLLALDMGAQPLPTSFKTVESLRIQPKTHQKSNSAPSSLPRIKHKNSSNMIRASISSPMLIKTSLCPSTLASCRDIQRSVDESTEPVSENSPPVISKSRSSNMRQQWKRFKIYA